MSQYRDEHHAASRALNCGEGRPAPAKWQSQYIAGYRESSTAACDALDGIDKLLADASAHARLHKALTPDQYQIVILKHSGSESDRIKAVRHLAEIVGTNAGKSSKIISVGAWALKGYDTPAARNWDQQEVSERTLREWRRLIHRELSDKYSHAMAHLRMVFSDTGLINA